MVVSVTCNVAPRYEASQRANTSFEEGEARTRRAGVFVYIYDRHCSLDVIADGFLLCMLSSPDMKTNIVPFVSIGMHVK